MSRKLIVGAGDLAREIFNWMSQSDQRVDGFLDDDPAALDQHQHYEAKIVGTIEDYQPLPGDELVMGINAPTAKLAVAKVLEERGANFVSYVDPRATISKAVRIGHGCVILPGAIVSCDAVLGNFVTVNLLSSVGHDTVVGDGCTLSCHCDITGYCQLGRGVFMGTHASILPKVNVGEFATIGAGSVVILKVAAGTTVLGSTARRIMTNKKN